VLWCVTRQDLFAPALVLAGLAPDRVIYVEAGDDKAVLACFEEALRHSKLGAVVAEVASLSMTASRRLQIAAEGSGVIGLALRRWRRQAQAAEFAQPTRWRISALPSTPLPVPGVGRARWRLELVRCRGGESAEFEVEACDAKGLLALPREVDRRPTSDGAHVDARPPVGALPSGPSLAPCTLPLAFSPDFQNGQHLFNLPWYSLEPLPAWLAVGPYAPQPTCCNHRPYTNSEFSFGPKG
jgi:protein ImuA